MTAASRLLTTLLAALLLPGLLLPELALADYYDDIGFRQLQAKLGAATPTGAAVLVVQAEGTQVLNGIPTWAPDPGTAEFSGNTISDRSGAPAGVYSGHATAVGTFLYGNRTSIAPGKTAVSVYAAGDWIGAGFLRAGVPGAPQPLSVRARVANHSWVGAAAAGNSDALRRLDWVIARDEFVNVVGLSNGGPNPPLLSSAYNVVSVGRSDGIHGHGTARVDSTYTAGRVRPDLVAPGAVTSETTPKVAAAVRLLIETGQANARLSSDPVTVSMQNRAGGTVRNAERSEVLKAALMAGALRIADYRQAPLSQAGNGLDARFGAGQLNVWNSYRVLAAGEQNNLEDQPAGAGAVAATGWDYDPRFGGAAGANAVATYYLPTQVSDSRLIVALCWNLKIDGGTPGSFDGSATLFDLDLQLLDVTTVAGPVTVEISRSKTENSEHLWLPIRAGRQYALQVSRPGTQPAFDWDFALAWRTERLR